MTPGDCAHTAHVLAHAQAWAAEPLGVAEWARDPYGSYGPAEYVRARTAGYGDRLAPPP